MQRCASINPGCLLFSFILFPRGGQREENRDWCTGRENTFFQFISLHEFNKFIAYKTNTKVKIHMGTEKIETISSNMKK